MNSSQRVTLLFSLSSLLTLFSQNQQRDISERNEAYGGKQNILIGKVERSFLENCFVIREFFSQSYTILFVGQFDSTVLGLSGRDTLDRIEAYGDKGNILR